MPEKHIQSIKVSTPDLIIQPHVSLNDKNWFKTGGPAQFFCNPHTASEFQQALQFAHEHNLPLFMLGEGANVLISDDGFAGLVIQPHLKEIKITAHTPDSVLIQAGAGVSMHDLINYCLAHNILGLEEFSGIPGTIGGAVYINLHYFEFLIEQFLVEAQIIDKNTHEIQTVDRTWFAFGYNQSRLQEKNHYLVNATFALKGGNEQAISYAKGRQAEIIRHRTNRYPTRNTCGSFFRNFHEHEVDLTINNKKMIYIAYYLDKIGVKGSLRYGNAMVSHQHANMIVNCGNATTHDILCVARSMQELVQKNFGILPQSECLLIGFNNYPLLH
ncbi:MAG: UDP-N-acetylmuramate dehydrogenase [bacterium]|nr:UDP-N-acetylmuramate dehydrogenase [bacterium]